MHATGPTALARAPISPDHLLDVPLPELLADLGVQLEARPVEDPTFCGYIVSVGARPRTVVVSSSWSELVQDCMTRAMLGHALRVPLPPLPAPFTVTEL